MTKVATTMKISTVGVGCQLMALLVLGCTGAVGQGGGTSGSRGSGGRAASSGGVGASGTSSGGSSSGGTGGGAGSTSPSTNPPPGTGGTTATLDCSKPAAPRTPMRRLTRFEYNNTVRDIFTLTNPADQHPADSLPGEEVGNGFGNDAVSLGVSRLLIDGYRSVAHALALKVAGNNADAATLAGCSAASLDEATCSNKLISNLGSRLFRRPLEARETTSLTAVYTTGRAAGDFAAGARAVIERVLQSPQFLYRIELGEPVSADGKLLRPTPYEMASRLSYLFWGSAPDQQLLDAAKAGKLRSKADVLVQAQRMITDPKTKDVVRFFHGQLFGIRGLDQLVRDAGTYPAFKPGMGALFRQETEQFVDYVVWQGSGTFNELMTAPYTFMDSTLAGFYGVPGVSGTGFAKVSLDTSKRLGLLTQASILTLTTPGSRTNPVARGKWIYTNLLCGSVPDPPPNVPKVADPSPGLTTRQRFEQHRSDPACSGCHMRLDPIGFGFENYDGVGLWRDTDNDLPIDASGNVPDTDVAGSFQGAVELARKLGTSRDAQNCFVGKWLTYGYGRLETAADACTRSSLQAAFAASGGDIKQLLVALTQTDAFLYGPAATGQN